MIGTTNGAISCARKTPTSAPIINPLIVSHVMRTVPKPRGGKSSLIYGKQQNYILMEPGYQNVPEYLFATKQEK